MICPISWLPESPLSSVRCEVHLDVGASDKLGTVLCTLYSKAGLSSGLKAVGYSLCRRNRLMLLLARTQQLLKSAVASRPFHSSAISQANNMRVIPIPVRKDNYSYLIVDDVANEAAAVDPYTPSKVKEVADQFGVKVVAGITTHHHHDHSHGNQVSLV